MTQAPVAGTPGTHALTTVEASGRCHRAFALLLATDSEADALQVDGGLLVGSFQARTYDALAADPPQRLAFATGDDGSAVVVLPAPRRLSEVRLSAASPPDALAVHRVDRTVLADKAVAVLQRVSGGQRYTAPAGLEVARFALRQRIAGVWGPLPHSAVSRVDVVADPLNPSLAVQLTGQQGTRAPLWSGAAEGAAAFDVGARLAEETQRLLDGLPAPMPTAVGLELVASADAPCRVTLTQGVVDYRLLTRRFAPLPLRRSDVADPGALLAVLRHPTDPVTAHLRSRLAAATLQRLDGQGHGAGAAVLDAVLADLSTELAAAPLWDPERFDGVVLPPEIAVLVGPPPPTGSRLRLVNRLLLEAARADLLRPAAARRVLDVEANAPAPVVAVPRPPTATTAHGRLEVLPSVRPLRGAETAGAAPPDAVSVGGASGVAVSGERWMAAPLLPDGPVRAAGIDIAVLAQTAGSELEVVLRKDHRGRPDGALLRRGIALAPAAGTPSWARLALDEPLVLQPGPSWVTVRAATGSAVWLAAGAGQEQPGMLFTRDLAATTWSPAPVGALPLAVRVVVERPDRAPPVTATAAGADLGDPTEADGRLVFDLDGPLAAAAAGTAVPLSLRPDGRGQLTVYPPTVTYEL